jgi:hypothetical protein
MRHLCVVGPQKRIEGIVTRDDLHAAAHGPGSHEGAVNVHHYAQKHPPLAGPPPQVRLRAAVWRGVSALQFWKGAPQQPNGPDNEHMHAQADTGEAGGDAASTGDGNAHNDQ